MTPARIANTGPARLLCALLVIAAPAAWAAEREKVTLDQAIERALRHNPQMVQSRGTQEVAAAAERTAFGNYLPSLSTQANTSVAGSAGTYGVAGPSAGVSLSYDLFTGFRRRAQRAQAEAQSGSARAGVVQSRAGVALAVEQTFFENLRARELEDVAKARVQRALQGLDAAQRKSAAGSGTRSDLLRAELERNTADRALLEARTQRETSAYALGRQIGADGAVDADADAQTAMPPAQLDEEQFVNEVLQASPDVRLAEASLRSAQAGVQVARSEYFPQLSLGTGYDWRWGTGSAVPVDSGWSVGLGLSYPLFDGFRREETGTRARVQESVASATLADTRRAVRANAEQLLGSLRLAREQIGLAEKSVAVAEEDLRVQQERYRMGVTTMLELLTSQASVVEAQTNLAAARFDYRLAYATLLALAGRQP
ncbi:MAG TPA: TolC family protein [Myxococcaceae bacterium]|nr:TolC family protein [Myxococcaceae bacterium]